MKYEIRRRCNAARAIRVEGEISSSTKGRSSVASLSPGSWIPKIWGQGQGWSLNFTLLRKRNQTLFHFSYLGKIKRAQLALSSQIRGKIVVFVVSRTLVSLPPSAGPPLDLGLAMAAPRVSLLLIAHSMRCFAPPSASMMPFICSVVLQDPPLGDGLFAPTVTPEVGGSSTKAPRHPSGLHLR